MITINSADTGSRQVYLIEFELLKIQIKQLLISSIIEMLLNT